MSSTYVAWPVINRGSSRRLMGAPTIAAMLISVHILSQDMRNRNATKRLMGVDVVHGLAGRLLASTYRLGNTRTHLFGGILDGTHDILVACAAADVAFQPLTDLGFGWVGVVLEQLIRGHDHAGSAEAALQTMFFPKA